MKIEDKREGQGRSKERLDRNNATSSIGCFASFLILILVAIYTGIKLYIIWKEGQSLE